MPLRPRVYDSHFGAFEIASLLDAANIRAGLARRLRYRQPEVLVRALAVANHIDPNRYEHPFIPVLTDTGARKPGRAMVPLSYQLNL